MTEEERSECERFAWLNYDTGHQVGVDLVNGWMFIDNQILHAGDGDIANMSFRHEEPYRLIYATRHTVINGVDTPDNYMYLVGWQKTIDGKNYKRILYVYPHGEVIFGGE